MMNDRRFYLEEDELVGDADDLRRFGVDAAVPDLSALNVRMRTLAGFGGAGGAGGAGGVSGVSGVSGVGIATAAVASAFELRVA